VLIYYFYTKKNLIMKFFILLLPLLLSLILTTKAQCSFGENEQEKKVLKLINSLPEVRRASQYVMKHSGDKRDLKAYIQNTPTQQQNYYRISVSELNGAVLVSHFWFKVNSLNYAISYYDVLKDESVPYYIWHKHPFGVYSKWAISNHPP
jgi:hypothetical protein